MISCNSNGTAIPAGRTIWFSSVFKLQTGPQPVTVYFRNQTIDFDAVYDSITTHYVYNVPDAAVTFDPSVPAIPTTTFDTGTNTRVTLMQPGLSGDQYRSGFELVVPPTLGQIKNPVTWKGQFLGSDPGGAVNWSWHAAVYTSFSTDYNALGVAPTDDTVKGNSHHAGTPENYTCCAVGGATGGGSANYTGSKCSSKSVPLVTPTTPSTWGRVKTIYR
ncbi:MAG: hypothetical protein A2W00_15420 [Candidatus Eisenbacteria bacterium RBG_16_71_46]|nr:MAG: hypothetical protein A2W00_15420 [Candidatus Eisenbacteria bacterium RBG_16_71_46]